MMNSPCRGLTSKALRRDGACSKTEFNYCTYMFKYMYVAFKLYGYENQCLGCQVSMG